MTTSTKAPSAGAMRAARKWIYHGEADCWYTELAQIIDRETHVAEMAELLRAIVDSCVTDADTCCVCAKDVDGDHRHSEGCVILLAERLLSEIEGRTP